MLPLQQPPAGDFSLVVWLGAAFAVIVIGVSIYIYRDARRRNSDNPVLWALGAIAIPFIVPIVYFFVRDQLGTPRSTLRDKR